MENTEQVQQQVAEEVPQQEEAQQEVVEAEATPQEEAVQQEGEAPAEATEAAANGEGDAPKEVKEGDLIKASTDNELKLFVGGLAKGTEGSHLKEYFSTFGAVVDATIMKDYETGKPRGFGFVLFEDKET